MKVLKKILPIAALAATVLSLTAQDNTGVVRRNGASKRGQKQEETSGPKITDRMQGFFDGTKTHDADLAYMREIYRQLDLKNVAENTPLYFPEDVVDGQQNLFRIILGLVVDGKIPAYEYLDGREVFTDQYKVKVGEMLDRFDIYYQRQGDGDRAVYTIEEADVPTGQVLKYYIIEKWEFDRRSNRMKTFVEAICPVLTRGGDFGGDANYPMFWVKFDQLRPYLAQQYVFLNDDNNLPQYSLDDYFNLGMYKGEIYKTKNLRNLSMAQMYPDEDDRVRAQDSIDTRLREFGKNLWVPTREEYLAMREAEEEAAAAKELAVAGGDSIPERTVVTADEEKPMATTRTSKRAGRKKSSSSAASKKKPSTPKVSQPKSSSNAANSSAAKSVRRRKR
ncbi:MAG: gliding motility protein GldN [Muribaculaceae bacterium]|nr:gliding motility protein GldN [Bacteroides sp.]MDE6194358.1 gliding motility protein GldN [Muribaculaceae bacterium]MDE6855287.1 gliding motility protein GldN [Muribaculaceae bacterium]